MDYTLETLNFHLEAAREFNSMLFEQMERESDFILSCLENMTVIMEATNNDEDKRNFFQKIIDFIKRLFGVFTEKAKNIVQTNQKWMDENFPKMDKFDFDGLEIDMVPFWSMDVNNMSSEATKVMNKIQSVIKNNDAAKYKDMENVKTELFKEYLDENGELAGGFKNFYRVGNARGPLKTVNLKGNELRTKVLGDFRAYCLGYKSTVIPAIKKLADTADQDFKRINDTLKRKQPTQESFCLVEDLPYSQTDLVYCENFVVLEAEQPAQDKKDDKPQQQNNDNKDKPVSATKVQMTDHGSKENAEKQQELDGLSSDQLAFAKNVAQVSQISISAFMTVAEERFNAYLNATKQIVKARAGKETTSDNNSNTNKEEPKQKTGVVQNIKNKVKSKKNK